MKNYLFNTEKLKYVTGEKPDVECILCAIRDNNPDVQTYEIYRSELSIISVNLYPFNPGHLMIFPKRHIINVTELTEKEVLDIHHILSKSINFIKELFNPTGFNIGYNIGHNSGASIDHLHLHIVPRYPNEIGYLDVLAGTRIIVNDPSETLARLKEKFSQ